MIRKTLFILFNIGFAVAILMLFSWLNELQVKADAQNKEYAIGETIPLGDIEVSVTKVHVISFVKAPEIKDPFVAFGGYRTMENCNIIIPHEEYVDCAKRNTNRKIIIQKIFDYRKHRLTVDYAVKSRTDQPIDSSKISLAFQTYIKRDMKAPIPIVEGVDFIPYGESEPVIKNTGKEMEQQIWLDLDPSGEPIATAIFTYGDAIRRVPIEIFSRVQNKP